MIIFDLDGTLADCEHRRHFIDPEKTSGNWQCIENNIGNKKWRVGEWYDKNDNPWKPDWKAFYEACYQDNPILPVFSFFNTVHQFDNVRIWSGRCESVRKKTIDWFMNKVPIRPHYWNEESWNHVLKMRPIGDYTADDQLKEKWLDEYLNSPIMDSESGNLNKIQFVFDDRPKVVRMWRRRGIFVFNCLQNDEKF